LYTPSLSERIANVTSVDERVRWLRGVGIFGATPDEALAHVVTCLQPVFASAGQTVFAKGSSGDSLYIIVEGQVGVYDGGLLLNYLTRGNVFGEMAILDTQPRSASVIAVEDSHFLRLDQAHVFQLMAEQNNVARAVIEVLCQRVRAANTERVSDFAYIEQVAVITAAAQDLAREVRSREQDLKQQVNNLRIEIDQVRQARQVAEIVNTDYFQALQQRAQSLRMEMEEDDAVDSTLNAELATTAQETKLPHETGW
jgi:CRP-like cAMP-binding protein